MSGPSKVDWRSETVTDAEVVENTRAMRADMVSHRVNVRHVDGWLADGDQAMMRQALNSVGWLLWR